ncbi:polysaccharide lyase family 8 super-sandwich domain-containing protein [uncultured Cetobacterium sp.]|uniref:polysaccharide lyase family 8 super-sandwich domain-containing protein n=1 Tax=uncultured Cetobacterium sp. TaxID=527638 RepID=UPI0026177F26|nr:polysaccharide lyase family 8 super-sandwich domain-containing protein [uncultured Cetobacterium sp.]
MEEILRKRIEFLTGGIAPKETLKKLDFECTDILKEFINNNSLINNSEAKFLVEAVRNSYKKILVLGIAYNTTNSTYYKNETLFYIADTILKNNYQNFYNLNSVEHTNWWQWEIGYPLLLNDILILFYNNLNKAFIKKILKVTAYFLPDEKYLGNNPVAIHPSNSPLRRATGGNLIDTCKIIFLRGALLSDMSICKKAVKSISETLEIIQERDIKTISNRDGFYKDGSFIQHGFIPYVGTYGNVLLSGIAEIIYLVDMQLRKEIDTQKICERVYHSFEPLFFKGAMTDMVNGRAITRDGNDHQIGHEIINSILLLADGVDESNRIKLLEIAKRELFLDKFYTYKKNEKKAIFYNLSKNVLENVNIKIKNYNCSLTCFNEMNRIFYRNKSFAIGVAMHSTKIGNFETFNGENQKGWFTSDGAIYLYVDGDEYIDYWKYLDFHYIPGTTEIKMDMENIQNVESTMLNMPKNTLAKGYKNTVLGSASMDFINWNGNLKSKKNYIFTKTGMIYLENSITGVGDVYHTVANLKLSNSKKTTIFLDNKPLTETFKSGQFQEIKIGNIVYKFFKDEKINLELYGDSNNRFIKIWIDLGRDPINYTLAFEVIIIV